MTTLNPETLRELVRPTEPVTSVYLGLEPPRALSSTEADVGLRWRAMAGHLAALGADEANLSVIAAALDPVNPYTGELAIFAAGGDLLLNQPLPGPARFDRARHAAPAEVVPLLLWLSQHPAYVSVVTDRCGADIRVVHRGGTVASTSTVVGPDDEIERNAPGGWAQPRYQRRAEDSWQHNAAAVADVVNRALVETGAHLLLLSGDVRAVQLLRDRLPQSTRSRVTLRHLPGGRSPDGSDAVRQAATLAALDGYVTEQLTALLGRFTADRGPHGTAVEGIPATLSALAGGRVSTLLVTDDPDDRRRAWFGPDLLCAPNLARTAPVPAPGRDRGRLVDVAVRAALLTDADVQVLEPEQATDAGIRDGIGALCRFRAG